MIDWMVGVVDVVGWVGCVSREARRGMSLSGLLAMMTVVL